MRKNFENIDIFAGINAQNGAEWQTANGITANWKTPELIDVKPVYNYIRIKMNFNSKTFIMIGTCFPC